MGNFWYFFCIVVGLVFTDLLFEAKYSELMNAAKAMFPALISYLTWGLGAVGATLGALWGSQMATASYVQMRLFCFTVACSSSFADIPRWNAKRERPQRHPVPLYSSLPYGWLQPLLSAVAVPRSPVSAVIIQLCCAASLVYASFAGYQCWRETDDMAQCNVFLFLAEITTIRLTGATWLLYCWLS